MKISLAQCAMVGSLMLTTVAGCTSSGSQVPNLASNAVQQSNVRGGHLPEPGARMIQLTSRAHISPVVHLNKRGSWIKPEVRHMKYLLYVSDEASGTVDVYAYRARPGHLLGQLTGFQFPYGECADSSGNVYIADFGAADIVEYAHGGSTPIKTLADNYGYPVGCSVDPTSGNLAVANFEGIGSTCMGGVVIYKGAAGNGTFYQDKDLSYYWPPGYDPKGNLYVQGQTANGTAGLAELASGSQGLVTLRLSGGTISYPGSMQWDSHYMTATDQSYHGGTLSGIYRVSVSGTQASIVDSTELSDGCLKGGTPHNDVVEPFINSTVWPTHRVVGGNLWCTYRTNFWKYKKGGDPKRSLPYDISPELAAGQTISPMPTK